MSRENVELARRGYAALDEALTSGAFDEAVTAGAVRSLIDEFCDPGIVLKPSGRLPESSEMHGHEGMLTFLTLQMEPFEGFSVQPQEFIDAGDKVVVPVRFGGRAVHTGIDVAFEVVHVLTARRGKWTRLDMYPSKSEALEAVGLGD